MIENSKCYEKLTGGGGHGNNSTHCNVILQVFFTSLNFFSHKFDWWENIGILPVQSRICAIYRFFNLIRLENDAHMVASKRTIYPSIPNISIETAKEWKSLNRF